MSSEDLEIEADEDEVSIKYNGISLKAKGRSGILLLLAGVAGAIYCSQQGLL